MNFSVKLTFRNKLYPAQSGVMWGLGWFSSWFTHASKKEPRVPPPKKSRQLYFDASAFPRGCWRPTVFPAVDLGTADRIIVSENGRRIPATGYSGK